MRVAGLHRFVAAVQRMSVIERWNNKPNLLPESVAGHSFLVAVVARALVAGRPDLDPTDVLCRAVAHDMHESLTGDILAPTKGAARELAEAVHQLERQAGAALASLLPEGVAGVVAPYVCDAIDGSPAGELVRTADLFAAWLKARVEVALGNSLYRPELRRIGRRLAERDIRGLRRLVPFARRLLLLYTVRRFNNLPALAPKSVAAHAHLVATVAWLLAVQEGGGHGPVPLGDILARALLLEAPKAVTGDILYHARTASPAMHRGVELVRARAAAALLRSLPPELRPALEPYFHPLPEPWEKVVVDAALVAAYLEALIEVRLGNAYFEAVLADVLRRLERPLPSTAALVAAFEAERRGAGPDAARGGPGGEGPA